MAKYIIAYDLGTTACKATVFDANGVIIESYSVEYETVYPQVGWHEQRPMDCLLKVPRNWSNPANLTKTLLSVLRFQGTVLP